MDIGFCIVISLGQNPMSQHQTGFVSSRSANDADDDHDDGDDDDNEMPSKN